MRWTDALREGFRLPAIARSTSLPDAVSIATGAVAEHLLHSETVKQYLAGLPKGEGTYCPDSPLEQLVKYVGMQSSDIDKADPWLTLAFLKELIVPVLKFERTQLLAALYEIDDVSEDEFQIFAISTYLADKHDRLWMRWFEALGAPYQALDEKGREQYENSVKGWLSQLDYTVFDYDPETGGSNRRTWAQAFPVEIQSIIGDLAMLEGVCRRDRELAEYFASLRRAYACTDILSLEPVWADVDRAWVKIPTTSRIVPVHGMESAYEHPFGVSPEFRLEVRADQNREIIEKRRADTIQHTAAMGLSRELVELARRKLERIDISVFVSAIRSGVNLNFRLAGQAVPNRQEVLAEGGKIFLDSSAPEKRAESYNKVLQDHVSAETLEALKPFITPENILLHTLNHEFSHPVGRTPESESVIGGDILEEAKATLLGLDTDEWQDASDENRLRLIAVTVPRVIRFLRKATLEDATVAPYVRENLVAASTLFETGVLTLSDNGVSVNVEKAKSRAWFEKIREFNLTVIAAYQAKDGEALRRLAKRYCDTSAEPFASLIRWVNRS